MQAAPIVVTGGYGAFPRQSQLHPVESLLLTVNGQRVCLLSHFNERAFLLTRHISSLDARGGLASQPEKKPAD